MFDVGSIFANLDVGWDDNLDNLDLNNDGTLDADDCPFLYGSTESKLWWKNIMEPYAKSQSDPSWTEQYGDKVAGGYKGKPLVPGEAGKNQADYDFLVDKIRITQGLSTLSAKKIAGKVFWSKYG